MSTTEMQKSEQKRQAFKAVLRPFFPSIVSVLALSDETSKMMKEENKRRQREAAQKRATQKD